MNFTICKYKTAEEHLDTGEYDAMISISVPERNQRPEGRTGKDLLLDFWDVTPTCCRNKPLPSAEDVIKVIKFARETECENILIHCHAGRSRSTACAIIFLIVKGLSDEEAVKAVFANRRRSTPNWHVLAIADHLLGTNTLHICRTSYKVKSSRRDLKNKI
jgi:predicted protein tyrosine phosphatase